MRRSTFTADVPMQRFASAGRVLLPSVLLAFCATLHAAELSDPTTDAEPPQPPRLVLDDARPANAPTADAIDALAREDGPGAARTLAAKALDASRIAYGPKDARTLVPLINLAAAEQRAGDLAASLRDYRAAIELGEFTGGPREDRLFEAWYGLAYAHQMAGQAEAAASAYGTALQLNRVNRGLYSAEQLDVLHALALALRATGHAEDADATQARRLEVAERVYGVGTEQLVDTYLAVGRWFRQVGRIADAITLHALAVDIVQKQSKDNPRLIDPLLELALSGGQRRVEFDQAPLPGAIQPATALKRAEALIDARTGAPAAELARQLIRVGDVHMALGRLEPAMRDYAKAAALLAPSGVKPPYDQPAFVRFDPPRPDPVPGDGGYVLAEFTVSSNGRIDDVRILETKPRALPTVVGVRLATALRAARLRPRIDNGKPVQSVGVRYRLRLRGGAA